MKIVVLKGSPRKNGNTNALLTPVLNVLSSGGCEYIEYELYDLNIRGCRACLGCQQDKTKTGCVIDDDMQPILEATLKADAILVATPIYAWYCTAPMKAVLDRYIYANCKYYGDDPHGPSLLKGKKLYVLTTFGYPEEKASDLFKDGMKRYCKHCGLIFGGMLGERQRNLKEGFMDDEKTNHAIEFATRIIND